MSLYYFLVVVVRRYRSSKFVYMINFLLTSTNYTIIIIITVYRKKYPYRTTLTKILQKKTTSCITQPMFLSHNHRSIRYRDLVFLFTNWKTKILVPDYSTVKLVGSNRECNASRDLMTNTPSSNCPAAKTKSESKWTYINIECDVLTPAKNSHNEKIFSIRTTV